MPIAAPEWLKSRSGDLQLAPDGETWAVMLDRQPQYLLTPVPAGGQYGCRIVQTINGKRFDQATIWPTWQQAVEGGLEELRKGLGW